MRHSPSTVPSGGGDTYLVLDDLGRLGRVWRETIDQDANLETLIRDLFDDQYSRPTRIVAFNTAEGWSRDVTSAVAEEYANGMPSTTLRCRSSWNWHCAESEGGGTSSLTGKLNSEFHYDQVRPV
jgi:hypothetical protein